MKSNIFEFKIYLMIMKMCNYKMCNKYLKMVLKVYFEVDILYVCII